MMISTWKKSLSLQDFHKKFSASKNFGIHELYKNIQHLTG